MTMGNSKYSPCDYVMKVQDNQPKPLTREMFDTLLDDMDVKMNCDIIRDHKINAEAYKKKLPGICWQSYFEGKLRTEANAQPTGLFCLDVDYHHSQHFKDLCKTEGVEAAWRWGEQLARKNARIWANMQREQDKKGCSPANDLAIVAIHISPQNAGVHVVACCNSLCRSIEDNQKRLAKMLGTEYDTVCKDWARLFFVTPREDWTYLDFKTIFGE